MSFRVPSCLHEGKISVVDRIGSSDFLIGEIIFSLKALLEEEGAMIAEEITND